MSDQEATELKGGHPPAVKVAGMRVVQNKSHPPEKPASAESKPTEEVDDTNEATGDAIEDTTVDKAPKLTLSGAPVKEKIDFPPEAIKSFHDKPVAQKQKHTSHVNVPNITQVHQPRSGGNH